MNNVQDIVEKCLQKMAKDERNMRSPGHIPQEMLDPSIKTSNEYKGWKPIKSIIDDTDLAILENKIGHPLPLSYRTFLKYKHFIELQIQNTWVYFPKHLPDKNVSFLSELVFNAMIPKKVIGKGYIYFADFVDYGILCFDTNTKREHHEYPIVYIDNYDLEEIHPYADNFLELLEADDNKGEQFFESISD